MKLTPRGALVALAIAASMMGAVPPGKVTWHDNAALGDLDVVGDADIDPWIFSAGLGYRFNLDDIFGHRAEAGPIK
jgi:hypothetical protein